MKENDLVWEISDVWILDEPRLSEISRIEFGRNGGHLSAIVERDGGAKRVTLCAKRSSFAGRLTSRVQNAVLRGVSESAAREFIRRINVILATTASFLSETHRTTKNGEILIFFPVKKFSGERDPSGPIPTKGFDDGDALTPID